MAVLTLQKVSHAGLNPSYVAAEAAGDEFEAGGNRFIHVKNGGASQITVTVKSQKACDQGFTHDLTVDVPAGEERLIGSFDPARFANSAGRVQVTYSDVTSVTVAALEV